MSHSEKSRLEVKSEFDQWVKTLRELLVSYREFSSVSRRRSKSEHAWDHLPAHVLADIGMDAWQARLGCRVPDCNRAEYRVE